MEMTDGYPIWAYRSASIRRWALRGPMLSFMFWFLLIAFLVNLALSEPISSWVFPVAALAGSSVLWWLSIKLFRVDHICDEGEEKAAKENAYFERILKPRFLIFFPMIALWRGYKKQPLFQ